MTIQDAKERLRIPALWSLLNLEGEPSSSCRCPLHQDRRNSFSVFDDGRRFKCHAGCGAGDAPELLRLARNLSERDACCEFIRLAGGTISPVPHRAISFSPATRKLTPVELDCSAGTVAERAHLAQIREVGTIAVDLAAARGLLAFGFHRGSKSWFILDRTQFNAQARQLSGLDYATKNGTAKALTLKGSAAGWPIGIQEAEAFSTIALVEGGPDLLAAFGRIWFEDREADCAPVAMLGAGQSIHPEALPTFAGKRVRIFGHHDKNGAGRRAVESWAGQLTKAGAEVDAFSFEGLTQTDGSPVGDFNDLCYLDPKQAKDVGRILP